MSPPVSFQRRRIVTARRLVRRGFRLALLVEEAEERGVLREIRLELGDPDPRPVLEPALLEVCLDLVEPTIAHSLMIGSLSAVSHEPNGLTLGPSRPIRSGAICQDSS